jgi:hypothetical protein
MDGTLNGIPLNGIAWMATEHHSCGFVRYTFRIPEKYHAALECSLSLGGAASLILSLQEIDGTVVYYSADCGCCHITIQTRNAMAS